MTYFEQIPVTLVKKLIKEQPRQFATGNSQMPTSRRLSNNNKAKAASVSQERPMLVVPFSGLR
jgi:hypothetical protein